MSVGRHRANVGGREEQARRALADHAQQAAEEAGPGPLLAGNRTFATGLEQCPRLLFLLFVLIFQWWIVNKVQRG